MLKSHYDSIHHNKEGDEVIKIGMVHHPEEVLGAPWWLHDFSSQLLTLTHFLNLNPASLMISNKHISQLFLFFDRVKVVDNHTNK